ncbi:hypothetical protein AB0D46_32490 [Streptomyces sp. NPDC048383]|uniref:hypothetical protein n=1 Tax=Streptomyces sp. NPDC048383 TaxID=3155386 RepID=UPI00342025BB
MPGASTCDHICWHPGCNGVFRAQVGEAPAGGQRHAAASGHPPAEYGLLRKAYVPASHPLTCLFGTCSQSFPAPFGGEVKAATRHARAAGHPGGAFIRGPHPDGHAPVAKASKAGGSLDLLAWFIIAVHVVAVTSLIAGFITARLGGTYGICDDAYAFGNCTDPHQEVHAVANVLLTVGFVALFVVALIWALVFLSTPAGQFVGFIAFGLITSAASVRGRHHKGHPSSGRSAWGPEQPGGGWVSSD